MIVFSAKGDLQKVNLNLETVASNFDHDEQKQGLLYESVYSSQLIAPNKAGWSSNQFIFKIQISLMKKYTISDECIKMTETKKPVEVTELINYHFPFTEKIKFVLH